MKKALDQTVRTVKREVNKKVLKVPEIERKVLEATCNEPWGPHGTLMADIAQASRNLNDYHMTMTILWKRLNDSGRNWRHVYKSLTVMEFLVAHGSERVVDDLREHTYQIQTLVDFQYIDSSSRDQGLNVRKKAQALVSLINDKEKIREVRQKAAANRDKYRGQSIYRPSSYSSTAGTYEDDDRYRRDDRYREDDKYEDRYSRDGDRNRDRDGDRYRDRDDDRYGGDRYATRDRYGDNRADGGESRYGYDDSSVRSSGSKDDDDWRRTSKPRPPPSYEEVSSPSEDKSSDATVKATTKVSPENGTTNGTTVLQTQRSLDPVKADVDDFDPRGNSGLVSAATAPPSFMSGVEELFADASVPPPAPATETLTTDFQPTNPFGSTEFRATENGVESAFGNSTFQATTTNEPSPTAEPPSFEDALALVPQSHYATESAEVPPPQSVPAPSQSPFQSFPPSQSFPTPSQPAPLQHTQSLPTPSPPAPLQHAQSFPGEQAFHSFPQGPQQSTFQPQAQSTFQSQGFPPQQAFAPQGPFAPPQQQFSGFAPQPQQFGHQQFSSYSQPFNAPTSQQSVPPQYPRAQTSQPQLQGYNPQMQPQAQQQQAPMVTAKAKQQEKFEPKSAVWADTLSLVDLNIGPLTNDPLAELGIQIKESKVSVSQQRKEEKTPTTMGKAMGAGSGMGIAAAGMLPPAMPPPPPIMNGGMPMGPPALMPGPHMMAPPGMMGPGMGMMRPPSMMNHGYPQQQPQYGGYR